MIRVFNFLLVCYKGVIKIALPKGGLSPGKSISNVLKIKCPEQSGKHPVDILVLYAGDDEEDEECKKMCSRMRQVHCKFIAFIVDGGFD